MADDKSSGGVSIGNVTGGITHSTIAGGDVILGGLSPRPDPSPAPAGDLAKASPPEKLAKLHQNIAAYFGDQELRSLCFDLGVDYAAERIFLRKVGGGYIFVHRLLMEYFASLEDTVKAS